MNASNLQQFLIAGSLAMFPAASSNAQTEKDAQRAKMGSGYTATVWHKDKQPTVFEQNGIAQTPIAASPIGQQDSLFTQDIKIIDRSLQRTGGTKCEGIDESGYHVIAVSSHGTDAAPRATNAANVYGFACRLFPKP